MKKEEFYEFVNKQTKPYDDLTLLEIGVKFKELPVKQRNWGELVDYLDLDKTANAFRCWIYSHRDDLQVVKEEVSEDNSTEQEVKEFEDQYKVLTQNRDILNAIRKHVRNAARVDILKQTIVETVDQLNALPEMYSEIPVIEGNNEAVMLLSDMHIGVQCENFCNKYNTSIAEKRLNKFVNDTIRYCKMMNVKRLNILNLGDMIHGIIHTTARIEEEFDVVKQVMVASELLAKALNQLQQAAPEIIYRSVTDNHSRAMANVHENIENENFYRLIDWYLEERLKDTNIVFDHDSNLDPSFVFFRLLNGQTACAAHGHLDKINTSVQNFSGLTHTFVDNIFLAHYHDEKVKNFQGATVFVNGSIVGPEQYSISKRLVGYATQKLIIYSESSRMDISIKLN